MTVLRSITQPLSLLFLSLILFAGSAAVRADDAADNQQAIQDRFDTAMTALNAERAYTARKLLKELLADYPTLHRARLELARANYLIRDFDAAEAEIQTVLADPEVPASVRTTLLAFQAQIRDDKQTFAKRHNWSGQVYGGLMYDSNVNFGIDGVIPILGNPFTNKELSDGAAVLDAGILHTYNPNVTFQSGEKTGYFLWQTQGNGYYRAYFDENDYNLGVLTLRTGPAWVVPEEWRASIGLQGDQIFFGGGQLPSGGGKLAFFTTINPQITWQLDDRTDVTLDASATDRDYDDAVNRPRNGREYRAGISGSRLYMNRKLGLQAGVAYSTFKARARRFAHKGPEVYVGAFYEAWERGQVYTRLNYRQYDFKGPEITAPFTGLIRDEDEWRLIVGFRHELQSVLPGWAVRGDISHTINDSNVQLYDYDRTQVSLGLQRSF